MSDAEIHMSRMIRKWNLKHVLAVIGIFFTQLELNVGEDADWLRFSFGVTASQEA